MLTPEQREKFALIDLQAALLKYDCLILPVIMANKVEEIKTKTLGVSENTIKPEIKVLKIKKTLTPGRVLKTL